MSSPIPSEDPSPGSRVPREASGLAELQALVARPRAFFTARLAEPPSPQTLFVTRAAPVAAVRPVAVLVRSAVGGTPLPGLVLGLGSWALLIGTWLGLALVLPALARQFQAEIDERQAFALTTYASLPVWLAGVLYVVPEEPAVLFFWSRLLVAGVALFCTYLARQGIVALGVRRSMQLPLLGGIVVAAFLIYGLLFFLLGFSSFVALFILG